MRKLPLLIVVTSLSIYAAGVTVVFDPANPSSGPFPSDALTVADPAQKTGRRVNLPLPDCSIDRFGCILQPGLNQFDGFNLQPRIRVRFSAAVNPDTLRNGIYFVALENLSNDEFGLEKPSDVIPINEVVYDPATFTAFAKPDAFLDQHRRFALVVTTGVKDIAGDPVSPSSSYLACQNNAALPGCPQPPDIAKLTGARFLASSLAAATVFTTASATSWPERARNDLGATDPAFKPGPVVALASFPGAVWHQQTGTSPDSFNDTPLPFALLQGISRVAFGVYSSPNYLNAGGTIDMQPTAVPLPRAGRTEQIQFNVFLPAAPKPAGGYPVAIFGHGLGSDRFGSPGAIASSFAAAGYAVIGINAVGHGFGPRSSVIFSGSGGQMEVPAPGRGVPQAADGAIMPGDGCIIFAPLPVGARDCILQTVVDLMQLTRVLRSGVDLDGDGSVDLDPTRIAYAGHSLGAIYGSVFNAVEPSVPVAALIAGGGTSIAIVRTSPSFRPLITQYLASVSPSLLNSGNNFDDNWPLRYEPVRLNTVKGAIDLQEAFEKIDWLTSTGDSLNFAPHLGSSTLAGVPIKRVLWQYPIGDQTNPNPSETALVRAANMRESTRVYRADIARGMNPALPVNPHVFILDVFTPASLPVALAAQSQVVGFIASGGTLIPDPSPALRPLFGGKDLFEAPGFLTESLNFMK